MRNDIKKILIDSDTLQTRIKELGLQITKDYEGKDLLLVGILKGSVMFMGDLMKSIDTYVTMEFMAVSSYGNSSVSSGVIRILKDLDTPVEGKDILIVEDIIDTGLTLKYICEYLMGKNAKSIKIVTLIDKPSGRKVEIKGDYKGFEVGDEFVVGYGLDFAEKYRNLPYIGVLKESMYK